MQAVIFDLDGVLADSTALHFQAFRALALEQGVTLTQQLLDDTFGRHNRDIMPRLLGRPLSPSESEQMAARKEALYRERAVHDLRPIPGAMALLEALREARLPLAVGSSGPRINVELGLRVLGMAPFFGCVVTGDDATLAKPHPEIFERAAAGLGIPAQHCVVIEDAPSGITAALAAGMRVLAVATSCPAAELSKAHRVVESLHTVTVELLRTL